MIEDWWEYLFQILEIFMKSSEMFLHAKYVHFLRCLIEMVKIWGKMDIEEFKH